MIKGTLVFCLKEVKPVLIRHVLQLLDVHDDRKNSYAHFDNGMLPGFGRLLATPTQKLGLCRTAPLRCSYAARCQQRLGVGRSGFSAVFTVAPQHHNILGDVLFIHLRPNGTKLTQRPSRLNRILCQAWTKRFRSSSRLWYCR